MNIVKKLIDGEWTIVYEGEHDIVADARNAQADAEAAQAAAETAQTAAEAAQAAAETAETNAGNSATASASSATASATAQAAAETARDAAQTAQTAAEAAQAAAETAETNAGNSATSSANSATASATAQAAAETARDAAQAAQAAAETAKTAAETAQAAAESARDAAQTAQAGAETAETNAGNSATAAQTAKTAAELAQTNAATSATEAETAKTAAETAQTNAETAETGAETAEGNVNAALAEIALFLTDNYRTEYIDKYNLEQAGFTVSNITAYKERIAELLRLFALGFRTFMTVAEKTGQVGFLKHDKNGVEMVYPPTIIQAPFTRTGTGREVIDADGNTVTLAANIPAISYPVGGQAAGKPFLSFKPADGSHGADALSDIPDLQAAGYLSNVTEGACLIQVKPNGVAPSGAHARFHFGDTGDTLKFALYFDSNGLRLFDYETSGGAFMNGTIPFEDQAFSKCLLYWNGATIKLYINGEATPRYTGTAATDYHVDRLSNLALTGSPSVFPVDFKQFAFIDTITEADAIAATSWDDFNEMAADLNYQIQ